jgi:integrase
MRDVIAVALGQALRLGEVAGLDWKDIDFDAGTLTIKRSVCKKTGKVDTPGRRGSDDHAYAGHAQVLRFLHMAAGRPSSEPVFASEGGAVEGGYRHPATIERAFAEAYRKSGVETPGLGMHSLRHTAITHLANNPSIPLDAVRR